MVLINNPMAKKYKYEYKVTYEDLCANNFDEEKYLNDRGKEGWKLVAVVARTNGKPILYFRRKYESTNGY